MEEELASGRKVDLNQFVVSRSDGEDEGESALNTDHSACLASGLGLAQEVVSQSHDDEDDFSSKKSSGLSSGITQEGLVSRTEEKEEKEDEDEEDTVLTNFAMTSEDNKEGESMEEDELTELRSVLDGTHLSGLASGARPRPFRRSRCVRSSSSFREAVAKGRREPAIPSRTGERRFKIIHKGVVYLTDEDCQHEISKWRLEDHLDDVSDADAGDVEPASVHAVFVVDHSGSMRRTDVNGDLSRTKAVYQCLIRDFLQPQLKLLDMNVNVLSDAAISLISMSSTSELLLNRVPLSHNLVQELEMLSQRRAHHHGHYIPALEKLKALIKPDGNADTRVMVFWLSDGASSDHIDEECVHGINVWQETGRYRLDGRPLLQSCDTSKTCRQIIKRRVAKNCIKLVQDLGDLVGQENISFSTVGFGPASEDYTVLKEMASVLPKGSFQKLGLEAHQLGLAFTSLTSTMTSLRTSLGGSRLTPHGMKPNRIAVNQFQPHSISQLDGWDIYVPPNLMFKMTYSADEGKKIKVPMHDGDHGIAMNESYFAEGAERKAFFCSKVLPHPNDDGTYQTTGYALVAKESIHYENLEDIEFHKTMAQMQARAQQLAGIFNLRVNDVVVEGNLDPIVIHFSSCEIYQVRDSRYNYQNGIAWIFAEPFLEGKFKKWNNNGGKVYRHDYADDEIKEISLKNGTSINVDDVPQAFSHFTWSITDGRELITDLQGIWNDVDGFILTDPVFHHQEVYHHHGRTRTDHGHRGIDNFFKSHECNPLCKQLGLKKYPAQQSSQ